MDHQPDRPPDDEPPHRQPPSRERRQQLRSSFDGRADVYEVRPPYPAIVWERLADRCGLGPGTGVVEIGPGSGQATLPVLDVGARVTAIELGAGLSDRLRQRTDGRDVEIITSSFEAADLPDGAFDLVLSATAFHWVDPEVGIPKAHALLAPGGWLALVWNIFGDPGRPDPFHDALAELLERIEPDLLTPLYPCLSSAGQRDWDDVIDEQALFEPTLAETFHWTGTHTSAELRALFSTYSGWIEKGPDRGGELLDELERLADEQFDGRVTRPYHTLLVTARKPPAV